MDASDIMNDRTNLDINEEALNGNKEVEVVIGEDKRTLNVTKTPVNRFALVDIKTCADTAAGCYIRFIPIFIPHVLSHNR